MYMYLKRYSTTPKGTGRISSPSSISQKVVDEIRNDQLNHLVEKIPPEKRRRCSLRILAILSVLDQLELVLNS